MGSRLNAAFQVSGTPAMSLISQGRSVNGFKVRCCLEAVRGVVTEGHP